MEIELVYSCKRCAAGHERVEECSRPSDTIVFDYNLAQPYISAKQQRRGPWRPAYTQMMGHWAR